MAAADNNTSAAVRLTARGHQTMNASPLSSSNRDRDRDSTRASRAATTDRQVVAAEEEEEEATTGAAVRAEVRAASSSSVARRRHRRAINRPRWEELPALVKVSSTNTAKLARSARHRAEQEQASGSRSRGPLRPTCRRRV